MARISLMEKRGDPLAPSFVPQKAVSPAPPAHIKHGPAGLVRLLIGQVDETEELAVLHELDGEVIETVLDVAVDGFRCVVFRPQKRPMRAIVVLSPREREIARMVAKGYPNKTIAAVLEISSWTVCTYLRRIFAKANVNTRASMVARLVEEGLAVDPAAGHFEPPVTPSR
jgi:DNA-binding CsgD family transcriptional regulator